MQFIVWQFTFILALRFWLLDLQLKDPLVFSNGQYLQDNGLLHGLVSISHEEIILSSMFVLVDAVTKWSEKNILFPRSLNTILDSDKQRDVLGLLMISHLVVIVSRTGGLSGLSVGMQYHLLVVLPC